MYTSRKARLYSLNFHSPRKPSVPIAKLRMGGTEGECEKRFEARRMVPSPPRVHMRSVFVERRAGTEFCAGSVYVYIGKGRCWWSSLAAEGSRMMLIEG